MKIIQCEITGIAPLLQHRFATEEHGENKSRGKKKVYDPNVEAEKVCYRNADGNIFEPSEHIFAAIVKAATSFTFEGKKSYKDICKSGIVVEPFEPLLLTSKGLQQTTWDSIDARRVVIQRAAVVRWRPLFSIGWKLRFVLQILDDNNLSSVTLKEILEKAGTIGIGDYRPRFGRFQITEWKE
jgi:hypothetical protein